MIVCQNSKLHKFHKPLDISMLYYFWQKGAPERTLLFDSRFLFLVLIPLFSTFFGPELQKKRNLSSSLFHNEQTDNSQAINLEICLCAFFPTFQRLIPPCV